MKTYFLQCVLVLFSLTTTAQKDLQQDSVNVQALPDDTVKVNRWLALSDAAVKQNFERGRQYAFKALALAEDLSFEKGQIRAHEKIGRAASYLADNKQAFEHYRQAWSYYERVGDKQNQASMLNRMGECKRMLGDYEEALGYFQTSLKINRELKNINDMGSDYISIGILYVVQGNEQEAENYFLKAIDSFRKSNNPEREHLTILNLGGLYREIGEFEKSIRFSEKARDYFQVHGPEVRLAIAYYNLGVAYYEMDQLEESKRQYLKSLEIFERLGDNLRINGVSMRLSEIALKQGELDLALTNAQRALQGFKEMESPTQEVWAYSHISDIYKARKDFEKALEYRLLYEQMLDSVNSEDTREKIAEIEEKYQSELKDQQLEQAHAEIEMNALILQKQQNQKYAVMAVALFILIILVLLYNQNRVKRRNNNQLREKNELIQRSLEEKEVLLKEIHHRVKNNLQFISSLLNLQARHVNDPETLAVLVEGKNRVQSMTLVHQKLYQEENLKGVQMPSYVENLMDSLVHSYKIDRSKVQVQVQVENICLDVDSALPVGLILNELITNAFKYAFVNEKPGKLEVCLAEREGVLRLKVADNGSGLTEEFEAYKGEHFGFELIHSLAEKLDAEVAISGSGGVTVEVIIKNYKKA